jgi:hypothetical protein
MSASATVTSTHIHFDKRELNATLDRIEAIARLMDGAFVLPGTNVRIGLDAVLGLVPMIGDVAGQLVSVYFVTQARRLGAPRALIARMIVNVMVDTVLGSVPIVGDVFDALFRANEMNLALLRQHLETLDARGTLRPPRRT